MSEICWGDLVSADPPNRESLPKPLDGKRLIQCGRNQKWNVKKSNPPHFMEAVKGTLMTPAWAAPNFLFFVGVIMYPILLTLGSFLSKRPARKRAKQEKKAEEKAAEKLAKSKPLELEQARLELVKAYALPEDQGGLTALQFQQGMDRLYAEGLPRAAE